MLPCGSGPLHEGHAGERGGVWVDWGMDADGGRVRRGRGVGAVEVDASGWQNDRPTSSTSPPNITNNRDQQHHGWRMGNAREHKNPLNDEPQLPRAPRRPHTPAGLHLPPMVCRVQGGCATHIRAFPDLWRPGPTRRD